jgi:hypothetical protein
MNEIYEEIIDSDYGGEIIFHMNEGSKIRLQRYLYQIQQRLNEFDLDESISSFESVCKNIEAISTYDMNRLNLSDEDYYEIKLESLYCLHGLIDKEIFYFLKVKIMLHYYLFI